MVVMQKLSSAFEEQHPDIKLDWVVLEENVLRQRVTTDIATNGGQFDVMTIGTYETPIWAQQGWLAPFDALPESYDVDDILKPVREALTYEDKLYALPFYAESSMLFYRKDLFQKRASRCRISRSGTKSRAGPRSSISPIRASTGYACAASPAGARTWPS